MAGHSRVRTLYSGISAGTEMTAYRGSNPYLTRTWDPARRLFSDGGHTFAYPLRGWGYSEVGVVVEVAEELTDELTGELTGNPVAPALAPGDLVYGVWGHRSEAVLPTARLAQSVLPAESDPLHGIFVRVGAIALGAVLSADVHLGEHVAVFGQGVLGLLTTQLVILNGGNVIAVDTLPGRLTLARAWGARTVAAQVGDIAAAVRAQADVDVAVEISGSYAALHEAVRTVGVGGRVVAAGFYQGEGVGLRLGEEFHHNRVHVVASQIGGVPAALRDRWTVERLHRVFAELMLAGRVDVAPLVTDVVPAADVATAFRLLDEHPQDALQVVLDFRTEDERGERAA
jgi:2-desacetyl-2-hydroxyethyl bacteriochlorophyllide A dehydrogenase